MTDDKKFAPPTEEREVANAAYVWRINCQGELVSVGSHRDCEPESLKWHFDRYWRAVERERETEIAAKASESVKQ